MPLYNCNISANTVGKWRIFLAQMRGHCELFGAGNVPSYVILCHVLAWETWFCLELLCTLEKDG